MTDQYHVMTSEEASDTSRPGYVDPEVLSWVSEREAASVDPDDDDSTGESLGKVLDCD
jgi:hypothetical protein